MITDFDDFCLWMMDTSCTCQSPWAGSFLILNSPLPVSDVEIRFELLTEHADLHVIGDKGYISAEKAAELA